VTAPQLAFPILALTVSLALTRPIVGRIRIDHAPAAVLGALLAVLVGAVPPGVAWDALGVLLRPVLTIISLMILTTVAERAQLFELVALYLAALAKGDGRRLFTWIFVAGTVTGAIFTNDAAVLIFTPLIVKLIEEVKDDSWPRSAVVPYYFAVLYVANLVGAFVISNPINLILADIFEISFLEYARWMIGPAAASIVVSYVGLRIFFRRDLPERFHYTRVRIPQTSRRFLALTGAVLLLTLAGFFLGQLVGLPTWAFAVGGAAVLLTLAALTERLDAAEIVRSIGWDVIVFVSGIFVIVSGMREAGLTAELQRFVTYVGGAGIFSLTLVNGFVAAVCSAIMNNHPTAYTMALAIEDMSAAAFEGLQWEVKRMLVFSALIGGDLGPKMLPIGSLAALMWFRMLRARGIEIPYALYVKVGIPVTLAAVLLSLLVLYLQYLLFGTRP